MPRSAGTESNTGSLVVIIFLGDLAPYRILGEARGDGGCAVVAFSLVIRLTDRNVHVAGTEKDLS